MKVQIIDRTPVDTDALFKDGGKEEAASAEGIHELSIADLAQKNELLAAENARLAAKVNANPWDPFGSWELRDPQQLYAPMNGIWSAPWDLQAAGAAHADLIKFVDPSFTSAYPACSPMDYNCGSDVGFTSVMMRNIPNNYTRAMLLALLKREGFAATFDFFYLPIDLKKKSGLGYAFINFINHEVAEAFCMHFSGFTRWAATSQKICQVTWSNYIQGFAAHVERYRNSAIMHESVPEEFKPMVLKDGVQKTFPPPTKAIPEPQERQNKEK
jgi:hypothetical protein